MSKLPNNNKDSYKSIRMNVFRCFVMDHPGVSMREIGEMWKAHKAGGYYDYFPNGESIWYKSTPYTPKHPIEYYQKKIFAEQKNILKLQSESEEDSAESEEDSDESESSSEETEDPED